MNKDQIEEAKANIHKKMRNTIMMIVFTVFCYTVLGFVIYEAWLEIENRGLKSIAGEIWCGKDGCADGETK